LGEVVADLLNETRTPGKYEVVFDGSSLASGVYYYEIKAGDPSARSGNAFTDVKKMVLVK
jgi:hypothetical protein